MRGDHHQLTITPGASADEVAAAVAALERFQRETTKAEPPRSPSHWKLSALSEGIGRTTDLFDWPGSA